MAAAVSSQDPLHGIFQQLKNKNEQVRQIAARELRDHVESAVAELSSDGSARLWNQQISPRLFEIIHSNHSHERLGGVLAIDRLLEIEGDETIEAKHTLFRLFNYVKSLLPSPDVNVMIAASKTLGRIAEMGGTAFADQIDVEVPRALEALQSDKPEGRHAAVLILRELARHSAAHFHPHVGLVLERIWLPLRDSRVLVREGAAELLAACLEIMRSRDRQQRTPVYRDINEKAAKGLMMAPVETVHGSLLAYRELFLHAGMFLKDDYGATVESILNFREHREPQIRRQVITLIPTFARYDRECFTDMFLHKSMGYLMATLKRPAERTIAFVAIGHVASAVGSEIKQFLEQIMVHIKEGLQLHGKKNAPLEEPIFQCLGMLAAASGHRSIATLVARDVQSTQNGRNPELIALALITLGSFDFTGHVLNEFVRSCALPYLDHDQPEVRQAAALTSCKLFVQDPIIYQQSIHSTEIVGDVLDKLLTVGIADPDPGIRHTVLSTLDTRFDRHLAQAENVRSLFIALNDEVFANREVAIGIIGRLAPYNPAYVVPSLRKALIQLLTELEYSTVLRNREESAKLLHQLVSASSKLIKPYALAMLKVLLPKARDQNAGVAANVIICLGELAEVGGEDLVPHVPALMTLLIETLQDQTSTSKRDAALRTMGSLCSNTGYVITPLMDYPALMPIFNRILRTEQNQNVRRETIRLMGILGALDPYKRKGKLADLDEATNEAVKTNPSDPAAVLHASGTSSEDYYQTVVFNALLGILKDNALQSSHHASIEAIMSIFKTQRLRCVPFLPQIIPAFFAVLRTPNPRMQEFYLQQLTILVGIVTQHIRNYLQDIIALIQELWAANSTLHTGLVSLIEALSKALDAEFRTYLPALLPPMLKILDSDPAEKRQSAQMKVLHTLYTFGPNVEEYMHLVIPVIVRTLESTENPLILRKGAIQTIGRLSSKVNFSDHASRMIHPLVRLLALQNNELSMAVMDTLCDLMVQLGPDFAIFVPMINKAVVRLGIQHPTYQSHVARLLDGERLRRDFGTLVPGDEDRNEPAAAPESTKMTVNQQHLKQAWDTSQVRSREDWLEWIRRLAVEFMKESPSHALRACMSLADVHIPLARELFNAAFVSCWTELFDQYQEDLVRSIETAITNPNAPPEIIHILLNLAEFMEVDDKSLPIEAKILGEYAYSYHAYAKALHYKELESFQGRSSHIYESLIGINTQLQQHDAALGTLIVARELYDSKHEEWYEKLGKWEDALQAYNRKTGDEAQQPEVIIGKMRCLHALGEWEQLASMVETKWASASSEDRRDIAPLATAAAWSLNQWDKMDDYIGAMKADSPNKAFYRAIISVHRCQFGKAAKHIATARDLLDPEMTNLAGESYQRSYSVIIRIQMLSELEEIIRYKQLSEQPDRQATMRKTWMKRLQGCQPNVETWQRVLQVRTLVLQPDQDTPMWIKFANLARKSDRMKLAQKTIESLLRPHVDQQASPEVIYAHLKFMWANGSRVEAVEYLRDWATKLSTDLGLTQAELSGRVPTLAARTKSNGYAPLLARCYLKIGQWQSEMQEDWAARDIPDILRCYYLATQFDNTWYKAWHTWAMCNLEVIGHLESLSDAKTEDAEPDLVKHVAAAIQGNDASFQETLRVLTLWFKFGAHEDVSLAMTDGFHTVNVTTWLEVIPQIIARIQTPSALVRRLISQLLNDVGRAHPQALIYPLTVASKSSSIARRNAATAIMDRMREHSSKVVDQALVVSAELIRVAILWHELWHEGLEEASRLYFTEKNPEAMIAVLEPLHDLLEAGPTTTRETAFAQVFGRELQDARRCTRRFRAYGEIGDLNQAWEIYSMVFKKVEKQLQHLTTLDLQYVSPELLRSRNLDIAVPGTYVSGRPVITIASFAPTLSVITSKQRPRRLTLKGSDGKDYQYVLKGHEDLRQDERVMQLFGLVNSLLYLDAESYKRHLHIQRFPVIPLAPNAGLLGWVQQSDTLHILVRDYRRKILLNIEYRLMLQMAPDYEFLTLLQKVEVFEYALDNTTGQDLYRLLWLKSANSEAWLDRRATYTRSLAVTSMVGHIMGLGDRHPSNLLLDRVTGKVVHIDFGDCFEVAMHREKYPEKVPFRLTRMLVKAMEVCGIGGSFKTTCIISMGVLRDNRESLSAVLEAFVYDPLTAWRLLQTVDERARDRNGDTGNDPHAIAQGPNRKMRADENVIFDETAGEAGATQEDINERALTVFNRVQRKLNGRDFDPEVVLSVEDQVMRLIEQATSYENLHKSILDYLHSSGLTRSYEALLEETGCTFAPDPKARHAGLLEKKWTSVIRLQKKIMDLETRNAALTEEISAGPRRGGSASQADWVPRAPAAYTLTGHRSQVTRVTFHPLYSMLASASEDATIKLWDWETGEFERTLKGHTRSVHDVEFDSKGRWLVSCGSDMSIRLWDGEKDWVQARTFVDHDHSVHAVRFMPGDTIIVSASRDRTVKMWNVESGHCVKTIQAHDDWVRYVVPSDDGKLLATCSNDHTARLWDASTAENKMEMRGHENVVEVVVFAPVAAYPAIHELASIESADKNKTPGQYIATGSRDRTIRIWSSASGQCLKTLAGHHNWVRGLVFHPNGQLLLSACDDKTIRVWDLKTGRCTKTIEAHDHFVTSLAWGRADAGEGRRVNVCASGSVDQRIKVWMP
ncbi:phosphatidylinositol kinase- protein kinase tor1 [Ceratobasidium sp. 392]|nr:phosphatidylinositol kinase- protein kinase tor1 [Ceratobasidium sp. 392]